jgi:CRP/FNR family transcriptional regulator, cyclic AMP receptor protein
MPEKSSGPDVAAIGAPRLSEDDLAALAAFGAKASWPAGFAIYQRGTAADGVFIVLSGRVVLRSRVRAGRGFIPWIASPGETFGGEGLAPNGRYVTDARAEEETETLFLSSARFRAFIREQPQHALSFVSQLLAERTTLLEKLRELTTLSVEQRLLTTLLRLGSDGAFAREDGRIELGSSRYRLLCELVGATRESVSLVLSRLVGDGLAERDGTTFLVAPAARLRDRLEVPLLDDLIIVPGADKSEQTVQ